MGAPSGDLQGPLSPLKQQEALLAPQEPVEVGGPFRLLAPWLPWVPLKSKKTGTALGVQWLGLHAPSAGDQV